ncbi:hypothetical protein [Hwangdonia sp.]|uniref:hypothetical protein n=1 Tax=Hwangdonia sp. TaxID=1883432 RepID=UPI003AB6197A
MNFKLEKENKKYKAQASIIFTSFFSTKPNGQGIGLMLIREVLLNHEFNFPLKTNDDNFTKFKIDFEPNFD